MKNENGAVGAEFAIIMALCLICQTQEQQMQAHGHQTPCSTWPRIRQKIVPELLRWTAGNLVSGEDESGALTPAAEADRPLTISLPKMMPGDDVEAFLEVFESIAGACEWPHAQWALRLPPLLPGSSQSQPTGICGMCDVLAGDVRSSDAGPGGEKLTEPPMGLLATLVFPRWEISPWSKYATILYAAPSTK